MDTGDTQDSGVSGPLLTGPVYDRLKWIAVVALPALGTLWFAIANIFTLPLANEVLGTIVALDTFIGALIGVSTKRYNAINS